MSERKPPPPNDCDCAVYSVLNGQRCPDGACREAVPKGFSKESAEHWRSLMRLQRNLELLGGEPDPAYQPAAWAAAPRNKINRAFWKGCQVCGEGDREDDLLGMYLDENSANDTVWLHGRCWSAWRKEPLLTLRQWRTLDEQLSRKQSENCTAHADDAAPVGRQEGLG
jgi:hypothetical protein